jgi:hypothetical protein
MSELQINHHKPRRNQMTQEQTSVLSPLFDKAGCDCWYNSKTGEGTICHKHVPKNWVYDAWPRFPSPEIAVERDALKKQRDALKKQRDELLEALELARGEVTNADVCTSIDAAIAAARGMT